MRSRSPTSGWNTTSRRRRWAATDAPFLTLDGRGEAELRERGSRFLGVAGPADSEEAARALLASLQRTLHDATHHCSAWRLQGGLWRANDAGEPAGSAGTPILTAIDSAGLLDVAVVVVRYFGGTKLGVGGLVRAYGAVADAAIAAAPRRRGVPATRVRLAYPYRHTAAVMRALDLTGAVDVDHGFSEVRAAPEVSAAVPTGTVPRLTEMLREQTAGEVAPELLGKATLFQRVTPPESGSA